MKIIESKPLLLIFPFDLLSHYLRCLMLARSYSDHFEVLFAYAGNYADFVSKEGYQTFHCKSLNAAHVMECVKKFDFSWINEEALEAVYLDQVRIIEKLRPAVVLGDTSLTLKMAAEKTGTSYISLMNGYMSKYYAYPRKISRTHPIYRYINILSGPALDLLTEKGEALAFYKLHRPFNKIRSKYGLPKKITYLDELEGDINLICDLPLLFPQKNLPGNYTTIPPLYYDADITHPTINKRLDNTKKTIFVTMGSTGDWDKITFLNNPYFKKYNLVTAGDSGHVLDAAHIIRYGFVNVRELFDVTDLVICQGGNGTIYQSLLYGIPLLCKTNNFEQEWNVAALERLDLGKSLDNIDGISQYVSLVEEWIERKDTGFHKPLKAQIRSEADKLPTVIRKISAALTRSAVNDLQHG